MGKGTNNTPSVQQQFGQDILAPYKMASEDAHTAHAEANAAVAAHIKEHGNSVSDETLHGLYEVESYARDTRNQALKAFNALSAKVDAARSLVEGRDAVLAMMTASNEIDFTAANWADNLTPNDAATLRMLADFDKKLAEKGITSPTSAASSAASSRTASPVGSPRKDSPATTAGLRLSTGSNAGKPVSPTFARRLTGALGNLTNTFWSKSTPDVQAKPEDERPLVKRNSGPATFN